MDQVPETHLRLTPHPPPWTPLATKWRQLNKPLPTTPLRPPARPSAKPEESPPRLSVTDPPKCRSIGAPRAAGSGCRTTPHPRHQRVPHPVFRQNGRQGMGLRQARRHRNRPWRRIPVQGMVTVRVGSEDSNRCQHTKGPAYPAVVAKDFERALIPIPNRRLMEAFNGVAEPIFTQIHNLHLQCPLGPRTPRRRPM